MEFTRRHKHKNYLNLTSLIDVMFLLLMFFMLTTNFIASEAINLNVTGAPASGSKNAHLKEGSIVIILEQKGKFLYDGEHVALPLLYKTMERVISRNTDKDIIIITNKGVNVQEMVSAMDQVRAAGGTNIEVTDGRK